MTDESRPQSPGADEAASHLASAGGPSNESLATTRSLERSAISWLPSMPAPLTDTSHPADATTDLGPGDRISEFEVLQKLGRGGFGQVYLARQTSLDRLVALKITPDAGTEGRTLAPLEHPHIVRVYSETFDVFSQRRLLCMQYVPGTTLVHVIQEMVKLSPEERSGQAVLRILDEQSAAGTHFDVAALADREELARLDSVEAVCWIGERLAEALDFAHRRGVLHLDLKPGNVLMDPYGRPLLADFNLSRQKLATGQERRALFGGTLAYMAPEHLDAFNPDHPATREDLDEAADLYSLGLVLFELLHGQLPFGSVLAESVGGGEDLHAMAHEKREAAASRLADRCCGHAPLDRVLRRCLEGDPRNRFTRAGELGEALRGCRHLRHGQRQLPRAGTILRSVEQRALLWLLLLGLLPHLVGSIVQITYNQLRIIPHLSPAHQELFQALLLWLNPPIYGLCVVASLRVIVPVFRQWNRVARGEPSLDAAVDRARRRAVDLPVAIFAIGVSGWLAGMVLFPTVLQFRGGPLPATSWAHFGISFLIAGLIANTYCGLVAHLVVLRVLYPRMWSDPRQAASHSREELRGIERRLRGMQLLAGAIPLGGAILMVGVGPQEFTPGEYNWFRILVTLLIVFGMLGARLAGRLVRQGTEVCLAMQGRE